MDINKHKVVCVAFPIAVPGIYDYEIPERFQGKVMPGAPVLVELKNRSLWGMAVGTKETSTFSKLKPVLDIKTDRWTDSGKSLIRLYEWIASYYQTDLGKLFKPLIKKGLERAAAKKVAVYQCVKDAPAVNLTPRQKEVYEKILTCNNAFTSSQLQRLFKVSPAIISSLCAKGALLKTEQAVRGQEDESAEPDESAVILTGEQKEALDLMAQEMPSPKKPFLLYGITGSGKTYIYIELVKNALAAGKSAIVLVPEISLTPQTISRFKKAIGPVITVIHSRMSDTERRESLEELVTGVKRVIIGVRSAILAPMENVGLVIVDEEHDGSYKQSDMDPRYNARDVAVMRAHFDKALAVLGSATPSFESYHNALTGKYRLVTLKRRFGEATLPHVEIVDMGLEHKENNWTILSRVLHRKISETVSGNRQVILLLNRRGFSTFLICKDCGHTYSCPNCSVKLTFHKSDNGLKCHQCGFETSAPECCPKCKGEQIKYKGTGIQRAEEFLKEQFPDVRILRMDQDTTRRKGSHQHILGQFAQREADILLGTQMVAKGLNFPGVALVGVLQADIGMHFPDFRATEKTFQLLTQVAGRAGREDSAGEVVFQTYFPEEAGILAARDHDFTGFYSKEISAREKLGYPPLGKLVRIIAQGEIEADVRRVITETAKKLSRVAITDLAVLGPAPAAFSRIKNNYRYCVLLKSKSIKTLQICAGHIRQDKATISKGVKIIIDVDPVNMM
jgi:primosomal protein N' (replication factor Y)